MAFSLGADGLDYSFEGRHFDDILTAYVVDLDHVHTLTLIWSANQQE